MTWSQKDRFSGYSALNPFTNSYFITFKTIFFLFLCSHSWKRMILWLQNVTIPLLLAQKSIILQ